jgi:hypothetical protein
MKQLIILIAFVLPVAIFANPDTSLLPDSFSIPVTFSIYKIEKSPDSSVTFVYITAKSQRKVNDHFWLKQGMIIAMNITAGWFDGEREVARNNYAQFAAVRPNVNPQWANPKVSFVNKYADWPNDKSEAFLGSSTVFSAFTDKHHFNGAMRNIFAAGGAAISITLYTKPNWKDILCQLGINWASYAFGTGVAHYVYRKR